MKYVLGIDLGTSGTKTVLFDQYGTAVCSALVEYPLYQPHNGWAEQKPEDWYHAAVDTIRSVLTNSGVDKKDVVSMGISGQMHGLVMLDEAGNVLRPSIIWVRPAHGGGMRPDSRNCWPRSADCDYGESRADRLHAVKAAVGAQSRAGSVRQVPSHSPAEGLCALYADRRFRD